jgi:hypothetical protein
MNPNKTTGYIALLDVLGFTELITRESRTEELQHYFNAVDTATDKLTDTVDYVLFSDTIVMYTQTDSEQSLNSLLQASSFGMHYLLKAGLPVRGAIAHGTYLRSQNPKGVLIAGPAFIDAYHFEKAQNWIGIAISPSVLRFFPKLKELCILPRSFDDQGKWADFKASVPWAMTVQPCHSIPWHPDKPYDEPSLDGYAVVPTEPSWDVMSINSGLKGVAQCLADQRLLASDPKAQAKYVQTQRWLELLQGSWSEVAQRWAHETS